MRHAFALAAAAVAVALLPAAAGATFGSWSPAVNAETATGSPELNTAATEGCPSQARDGLDLYFASNRPGGVGGLDIYVAHRDRPDAPWGDPTNLGPVVNTNQDEFCPTPLRDGHGLLFISRGHDGNCGGSDIFVTRRGPAGWEEPRDVGCDVNSAADEASPFLLPDDHGGEALYFSSARAGGYASANDGPISGDWDIYTAPVRGDRIDAPTLVAGVNTYYDDARPNLRRDGRELFFDSNRPGGCGSYDIYTATRSRADDAWSNPADLGCQVNSAAADTRASISWDGTTLYFGSTRAGGEGGSDLYLTTRERGT